MITLRLFKTVDPFRELEARALAQGELVIGRDPGADWTIEDPSGGLSRRHCALGADGERLWLCDTSTNGVFLGADKRRAPRGQRHSIAPGETLHLGDYIILLDADVGEGAINGVQKPSDAPAAPALSASSAPITDAALLEAFCHGARLEASSFAGEDPAAVMRRLGKAYRQVIDDLADLMSDRALLKDSLDMAQTSIGARDNNPLKWMKPDRVAVDLLREGEGGFLKGDSAFKASFADLRRHGACLLAGSQAAVRAVLEDLAPARLEAGVKRQPLTLTSRFETAWRTFEARHAELAGEDNATGQKRIERAFREGYEMQLGALSATGDEP